MIRRIGGLGGLAFLFLTLSTLFVAPAPPGTSASSAELAAYVRDNATGIELQAVIFGLAAFGLVAFASLFPIITVMAYAQASEWRAARGRSRSTGAATDRVASEEGQA